MGEDGEYVVLLEAQTTLGRQKDLVFRIYRLIEVELQNGRQLCAGIIEN